MFHMLFNHMLKMLDLQSLLILLVMELGVLCTKTLKSQTLEKVELG